MAKPRRRRRVTDFKPDITHRSGLAWFEREQHARMIEVMAEPHDISRDYERWREVTENRERTLKRRTGGRIVVRVVVDPDKFLAWCAARSKEPNGDALNLFVHFHTYGF